ncbi:MAG: PDZ domain-containing protein [Alphaproteobacteria bacterium]|nr:PDZ domain-containing protein [Alphaproteobacteria bacterium]
MGDPWGLNSTLFNLAVVELSLGRPQAGLSHLEEAARVGCEAGHPDCWDDCGTWYAVARNLGDQPSTLRALTELTELLPEIPPILAAAQRRLAHPPELGGQGVLVTEVLPGEHAAEAGMRDGDIIVRYDGQDVESAEGFVEMVNATVGREEPILLVIIRGDEVIRLQAPPGRLGVRVTTIP